MRYGVLTLLILFLSGILTAQNNLGYGFKKLANHPLKQQLFQKRTGEEINLTLKLIQMADRTLIESELVRAGFRIQSDLGSIITVTGAESALPELLQLPYFQWIDSGPPDEPQMTISRSDSILSGKYLGVWADSTHNYSITGLGTIVAVIDDGFSIGSGDYKWPDGTTRIIAIWNQATNTPARFPSNPTYSYGTEWLEADVNAGLVTGIPTNSHGSACLSIAASDGSATGIKGIAPEAEIILVIRKSNSTLTNSVDAFNYIQKKAAFLGKPVAVSYSFGSQFGPHDGTKLHEQAIDTLSGPGAVFVTAAGNSGGQSIHLSGTIPTTGSTDSLRFSITSNPNGNGQAFAINTWFPKEDSIDCYLKSPGGTVYGPFIRKEAFDTVSTSDGFIYMANQLDAVSDRVVIDMELINYNNRKVKTGTWKLFFHSRRNESGNSYDGWVYLTSVSGSLLDKVDTEKVITMPGTANEVITVAAYNISSGNRQSSSSSGPTRDNRQKPDLAAPSNVTSGAGTLGGTSAATPHVAGAVALLLQQQPTLSPEELKSFFQTGSRTDVATGSVPNFDWGYGKLNTWYSSLALNPGLPVEVSGFTGWQSGDEVHFRWQTHSERNLAGFELEYLDTQSQWKLAAGWEQHPEMTAKGPTFYEVSIPINTDRSKTYRLQSVDLDGSRKICGQWSLTDSQNGLNNSAQFTVNFPYPNPFSRTTIFPIFLLEPSPVQLTVFTTTGQLVYSEMFEQLVAGRTFLEFNGTHLASGVYLVRLISNFGKVQGQIVILR